jgi:hypothetical protein
LTTFLFEIIYAWIITLELLTFEIRIFQTSSDEETVKTKVVGLKKLCNFVVDNLFIQIRLGSQILIWKLDKYTTRRMNILFRHKSCMGEVVSGLTREAKGCRFECRWLRTTCDGAPVWLPSGGSLEIIFFFAIFLLFPCFCPKFVIPVQQFIETIQNTTASRNQIFRSGYRTASFVETE